LVLPHQQADPSANAKHSRTPLKNKQQVSKTKRAVSANALTEHSDNKTDFLRILTNYKF